MQIYIGKEGAQEGPYTLFQIHEMIERGEINGATMGWTQGEDAWKPLRDIPAVLSLIQDREKKKLDQQLAETKRPSLTPESTIPPHRLPSHAFSRFGARMIDLLLFQVAVSFFWAFPEQPESMPNPQDYASLREFFADIWKSAKEGSNAEQVEYTQKVLLFHLGTVFLWHLIETILIASTGTTLGKFLFRIRILGPDGQHPGLLRSFFRSMMVYFVGMGAGFEPIRWIANFFAFLRLQSQGVALWDVHAHTEVRQEPLSNRRSVLVLLVFILIVGMDYWFSS